MKPRDLLQSAWAKKIRKDLRWRSPNGRRAGYAVIRRERAEQLLADVEHLQRSIAYRKPQMEGSDSKVSRR